MTKRDSSLSGPPVVKLNENILSTVDKVLHESIELNHTWEYKPCSILRLS
jgi:hypothetical protein